MSLARLLVANRGEIAIRIARAAAGLGIPTVGVFSEDDAACLHVSHVDAARALAERCGVPVLRGTSGPAGLEEARGFLAALGKSEAALVKAVAGGGGRGMRVVRRPEELDEAWARCRSEAQAAFGSGDLYVE